MTNELAITIVICFTVLIITVGYLVSSMINTKKKNEANIRVASINDETERIKIYSNFDFDKIDERIDRYVQDAGKLYKLNNFEYQDPEKLYLTEDMMNEMVKSMVKDVMEKVTPAVFSLLRLTYNINNYEELVHFIYEKVKLYVLSYSLETNAEIEE